MKSCVSVMLVNIFCVILNAQTFTLEGTIRDKSNGSPVKNAEISISDSRFTTSRTNGEFILTNIKPGKYFLEIRHLNYRTKKSEIKVNSDTTIQMILAPKSLLLDEVKITAGRYEQDIDDLPYSASLIPVQEIEQNPEETVAGLLKNEPGISVIRDGSWGTDLNIRGMSRSNIVTLIDGDRIETANDLSARLSMFDLNDIERIEVIKGSASSLYGSGATGGIINVVSKQADFSDKLYLKGSVNTGYNSVNQNTSNGISLFSGNNLWHAKISGSYRKAENTQTPSGELPNSQFEDYSFSAAAGIRTFENQELKIDFQQFKAVDVGIPGAYGVFPENASVSYPLELRKLAGAEYLIHNISSSFHKLSVKYFHQYIERRVENIPGIVQTIPGKRVSVLSIDPGANHTTDGFQAQADFTFGKHYLIAGLDLWRRKYTGLRVKNQKIEMLDSNGEVTNTMYKSIYDKPLPDASFGNAGFYLQNETRLAENKLKVTLGGRFDLINIRNDETLNPLYETKNGEPNYSPAGQSVNWPATDSDNNSYVYNTGILYAPEDFLSFSLNASRSFRSPSLEERFQYIDLGNILRIGNTNLKPEKGSYVDLGIRLKTSRVKVNGSVFLNYLNDLVSEEPGTYEGRNALIKTNIGEASLTGFDFGFSVTAVDDFDFYGNASYVRGRDTKNDKYLAEIPPMNGILGVKTGILKEATINLSANFAASQWNLAEGEIPAKGYVIYNLGINSGSYGFGPVNLSASAGVENIFNTEYRDHLSTSRGIIKSEPGRNFYAKLNLKW